MSPLGCMFQQARPENSPIRFESQQRMSTCLLAEHTVNTISIKESKLRGVYDLDWLGWNML